MIFARRLQNIRKFTKLLQNDVGKLRDATERHGKVTRTQRGVSTEKTSFAQQLLFTANYVSNSEAQL